MTAKRRAGLLSNKNRATEHDEEIADLSRMAHHRVDTVVDQLLAEADPDPLDESTSPDV